MDVYLVPASPSRYELYCEVSSVGAPSDDRPTTLWGRAVNVFRRAVAEGEAARAGETPEDHANRGRVRRFITPRLAEAVAEQRLLWNLRTETTARLVYPDDLGSDAALEIRRRLLSADYDKHARWCAIDALLTLASAPIALLPGPNFLAYYFIFRTVGHFLSMRGAGHGMSETAWTADASPHLTTVRAALALDKEARRREVDVVANALGLDRLGPFVDDVADRFS